MLVTPHFVHLTKCSAPPHLVFIHFTLFCDLSLFLTTFGRYSPYDARAKPHFLIIRHFYLGFGYFFIYHCFWRPFVIIAVIIILLNYRVFLFGSIPNLYFIKGDSAIKSIVFCPLYVILLIYILSHLPTVFI